MTIPFSAMIAPDGTISFTHIDGRIYNIAPSHLSYKEAVETVKLLGQDGSRDDLRNELFDYTQPKKLISKSSDGRILVEGDAVTFDGKPTEPVITRRLITLLEQGFSAEPLFKFMTNLNENPSYHSVQQLYRFMDHNTMAITNDGMILAYKRVTNDYRDIYTGKFDNSVGKIVKMPRNEVNDNPAVACSNGLHVCSMSYLPSYGTRMTGNRVVICQIHPKDVVSVPNDYNNAKMRVCEYIVVGELTDLTDILGTSAVMDFEVSKPEPEIESVLDFNEEVRLAKQSLLLDVGETLYPPTDGELDFSQTIMAYLQAKSAEIDYSDFESFICDIFAGFADVDRSKYYSNPDVTFEDLLEEYMK